MKRSECVHHAFEVLLLERGDLFGKRASNSLGSRAEKLLPEFHATVRATRLRILWTRRLSDRLGQQTASSLLPSDVVSLWLPCSAERSWTWWQQSRRRWLTGRNHNYLKDSSKYAYLWMSLCDVQHYLLNQQTCVLTGIHSAHQLRNNFQPSFDRNRLDLVSQLLKHFWSLTVIEPDHQQPESVFNSASFRQLNRLDETLNCFDGVICDQLWILVECHRGVDGMVVCWS